MPTKQFIVASVVLACFLTSCGVEVQRVATGTPPVATATFPMIYTQTPALSETSPPPSPQPTVVPAEGITATQVNVRAEPSTASNVLGIIPPDMRVEITGKDPGESWWQINYQQGPGGKGWVTAQYINTPLKPEVPTIGGSETDPSSGNVAVVQQQLNVRSGPATSFNSLGTLNPQDVVSLTGKDPNGAWLQIDFPSGPEGKGWVNAAFVRAQGVENLPIIAESGQVVGTGTPTTIPPTPTATVIPAWEDSDSASSPVASVIFEPTGTQTLVYNGDISSPEGDAQDWIAFKPYSQSVFMSLQCNLKDSLRVEIIVNNSPTSAELVCGDQMTAVQVNPGSNYLVHVEAARSAKTLQYTNYILTIKTSP